MSHVYLIRMYGDGTRRFSERASITRPMEWLHLKARHGWEQIGVSFEEPYYHLNAGFMDYDGTMSFEAVNQIFKLLNPLP